MFLDFSKVKHVNKAKAKTCAHLNQFNLAKNLAPKLYITKTYNQEILRL